MKKFINNLKELKKHNVVAIKQSLEDEGASFEEIKRSIFKKSKGGDIKVVARVAKKLTKASAAHAGQAKALKRIVSKYV